MIGQVLGQVIALRRATRRLHLVVVVDQLGIPLAGVAAQEPVEAVETAPERPPVIGPGGGLLLGRHQMPLADHVGVVAVLLQHLRQETVLERDVAVITRIAGRQLGDRRHPVGVVVAAGDHAGSRRRTQRRGVHAVVAQPAGRERVQMRRGDRTPVTAELPEPGVVQNNEQHIGRSGNRPHRLRPRRRRLVGGPAHPAREGRARPILAERHGSGPPAAHLALTGCCSCSRDRLALAPSQHCLRVPSPHPPEVGLAVARRWVHMSVLSVLVPGAIRGFPVAELDAAAKVGGRRPRSSRPADDGIAPNP